MKNKRTAPVLLALLVLAAALLTFAACKGPAKPDYSAVAGTYHHRDSEGNDIADQYITLNADGTWKADNNASGTFKLDGIKISIIQNGTAWMEGTIENDILLLKYYYVWEWREAAPFYKAA